MTTDELDAMAGRLSEAQRRGMLAWKNCRAVGPTSNLLYDFAITNVWGEISSGMACGAEEFPELLRLGLLACEPCVAISKAHPQGLEVDLDHFWSLTPLGLAMRARLEKHNGAG